jgi:outer membrane protein TolC
MTFGAITVRRLLLAGVAAISTLGCAGPDPVRQSLDHRVLPPAVAIAPPPTSPSADDGVKQSGAEVFAVDWAPTLPRPGEPAPPITDSRCAAGPLSLPDAVALAYRFQPRLRVFHEEIAQARGAETVAFAPFLPTVSGAYSVGGFELNAGGSIPIGAGSPNFTFLPFTGSIPLGLDLNTGYEMAELRAQWLVTDFGRRMGRHRQAQLGMDIAQLQTDRAYETVANDVAVAYYQVLRARSLKRIAEDAVRRAGDDLDVAKKLEKGGVVEKEKVLRAEVVLSEASQKLDAAEAAVGIAVAGLNLAIGLNVSAATEVVASPELPEFGRTLEDCLVEAVARRRELQVAQMSIQSAQIGGKVARAAFRPKIEAGGLLTDFQQSVPRAHADLALGFIKLEWGLFEGGRRVGELEIADSKMRAAAAEAESLADTIAFQVNESYRQLVVARRGIDRSKPAVEHAREAYRLLRARYAKGDATPADVTDAETALTRAEQDQLNSTFDYLTAVSRLNFAIGLPPVATVKPAALGPPGKP